MGGSLLKSIWFTFIDSRHHLATQFPCRKNLAPFEHPCLLRPVLLPIPAWRPPSTLQALSLLLVHSPPLPPPTAHGSRLLDNEQKKKHPVPDLSKARLLPCLSTKGNSATSHGQDGYTTMNMQQSLLCLPRSAWPRPPQSRPVGERRRVHHPSSLYTPRVRQPVQVDQLRGCWTSVAVRKAPWL